MTFHYGLSPADKKIHQAIEAQVREDFDAEEIKSMPFNVFFGIIDAQNAYEEDWNGQAIAPYYFIVYNKLKKEMTV